MLKPSDQRAAVRFLVERGVSERRACVLEAANRSSVQYQLRRGADDVLVDRIAGLAQRHHRYGHRRIWILLRREGWAVNHKRVQRLWQQAQSHVRKPRRRRHSAHPEQVPTQATYPGQVWTYHVVLDACWNGTKLKVLPALPMSSRGNVWRPWVANSLPAARVIAVLVRLLAAHGAPAYLRSDNGPEFMAHQIQI